MAYIANRGYTAGASYSFSSSPSDYIPSNNIHIGYGNNFDVSYLMGNFSRNSNRIGYKGMESDRIGYSSKKENSILIAGGRGNRRRKSIEINNSVGNKQGQRTRKNNNSLTEIDLAIKNLKLFDSQQDSVCLQEFSKLEVSYHKEITFVKKVKSNQKHLEVIIKKVKSSSKKYSTTQ